MMSKKMVAAFSLYSAITSILLGWWYLAFSSSGTQEKFPVTHSSPRTSIQPPKLHLSSLNRATLHKALAGDLSLMAKLISEWDLDAQLMEVHLDRKPRRLSKQDYLRAQLLGRQLKNYTAEELKAQKELCRAQVVYDDDLKPFSLNGSYKTFFPQTYVSSSFLLSLLDPKQIVAIPQGLRKQTQLFSTDLTKQIKYDINHFNAEKLYLCRPDLAFVAHYSHPSTIQALIEQNIESFNLKYVNSLSEITEALLRVGHLIDMPLEAELMKIFIEAAMYSIDNRFLSLNIDFSSLQNAPKLLFLNHHSQFNIPTKRSLTGHLLQRVGMLEHLVRRFPNQQNDWMIPLDQEQIVNMNPDYLIIATTNVNSSKKQIFNDPVMHQINAVQNDRLCFVDEVVQQSPSQYIVLAYYDLFNAIASLIDP